MIAQLPLALRWPRRQRFEHFHAGGNAAAVDAVHALAASADAPWVYLSGPADSGKSHLLMAACQAAGALGRRVQYLPLGGVADRAAAIRGIAGGELLALDGLDAIGGDQAAEHALFDLYNRSRAEHGALLFAAEAALAQLPIALPDLRSRLGACVQFALKPLDDAERRGVLKTRAAARGIQLDDSVLDWLFTRYARDLGALLDLLDLVDRASLAAQRKVTVPFLRELLRQEGQPPVAGERPD